MDPAVARPTLLPALRAWMSPTSLNFLSAAFLGAITSTFSTVVAMLVAGRVGRDFIVDWMVVATIPLRGEILQVEPSWGVLAAGILFHQWADFSWAVVFFGLLGRWTGRLSPWTIALIAPAWALFTSAVEYFVILAWWQPIFTLSQAYWIGLAVHMASASLYPLFPWLRDRVAGRTPSPHRWFAAGWTALAALAAAAFAALAYLGYGGREWPPLQSGDPGYVQGYMRRMSAHHRQGVELALLAARKAEDDRLRRLGALMAASQRGENEVFAQWWRGWFGGDLPPATAEEHATMPGMLSPEQVAELAAQNGPVFDALFRERMSLHHTGAIAMAADAMRRAGDPRVVIMAHAIRYGQRGEIELMNGVSPGWGVTRRSWSNLVEPAGTASGENRAEHPHR